MFTQVSNRINKKILTRYTFQRCPKKIINIFLTEIFFICHRCQRLRWSTLSCEYLREFSGKFETALMVYSGAWGKLIHEKSQKSKISWHCPFNKIHKFSNLEDFHAFIFTDFFSHQFDFPKSRLCLYIDVIGALLRLHGCSVRAGKRQGGSGPRAFRSRVARLPRGKWD